MQREHKKRLRTIQSGKTIKKKLSSPKPHKQSTTISQIPILLTQVSVLPLLLPALSLILLIHYPMIILAQTEAG